MFVDLQLEPAGKKAEVVLSEWAESLGLMLDNNGRLEIESASCFSALSDLRDRCYDLGLSINAAFNGNAD